MCPFKKNKILVFSHVSFEPSGRPVSGFYIRVRCWNFSTSCLFVCCVIQHQSSHPCSYCLTDIWEMMSVSVLFSGYRASYCKTSLILWRAVISPGTCAKTRLITASSNAHIHTNRMKSMQRAFIMRLIKNICFTGCRLYSSHVNLLTFLSRFR